MFENRLKNELQSGRCCIGALVKAADLSVVERLTLAGFDFFVLDAGHVIADREHLANFVRAAGIPPLIRLRENNPAEILSALELGCAGIQVPRVDSAEEAKELVGCARQTARGSEDTLVVAHCETRACVESLDSLLCVENLDVIFIDPMDLSRSYGVPGELQNPIIQAAMDSAIHRTLDSDKAVGTVAATAEAARGLICRGVQYILLSSDRGMAPEWCQGAINQIRG